MHPPKMLQVPSLYIAEIVAPIVFANKFTHPIYLLCTDPKYNKITRLHIFCKPSDNPHPPCTCIVLTQWLLAVRPWAAMPWPDHDHILLQTKFGVMSIIAITCRNLPNGFTVNVHVYLFASVIGQVAFRVWTVSPYIRSGAERPSSPRTLRRTIWVAWTRTRRALSVSGSSQTTRRAGVRLPAS